MFMKKGLIDTCIRDYIDDHYIMTSSQLFQYMPKIFDFLKHHPHFRDLLPDSLTYPIFLKWATIGHQKAAANGTIFENLRHQFNSF